MSTNILSNQYILSQLLSQKKLKNLYIYIIYSHNDSTSSNCIICPNNLLSSTWNECKLVLVAPVAMLVSTGLSGWADLWCSTQRKISSQRWCSLLLSLHYPSLSQGNPIPPWRSPPDLLLIMCPSSFVWTSCVCLLLYASMMRKY